MNFPKYGILNPRRVQFLRYTLNKVKPLPCATEFETLNKWEAMELEREKSSGAGLECTGIDFLRRIVVVVGKRSSGEKKR